MSGCVGARVPIASELPSSALGPVVATRTTEPGVGDGSVAGLNTPPGGAGVEGAAAGAVDGTFWIGGLVGCSRVLDNGAGGACGGLLGAALAGAALFAITGLCTVRSISTSFGDALCLVGGDVPDFDEPPSVPASRSSPSRRAPVVVVEGDVAAERISTVDGVVTVAGELPTVVVVDSWVSNLHRSSAPLASAAASSSAIDGT